VARPGAGGKGLWQWGRMAAAAAAAGRCRRGQRGDDPRGIGNDEPVRLSMDPNVTRAIRPRK
jgi:hypothetical protein